MAIEISCRNWSLKMSDNPSSVGVNGPPVRPRAGSVVRFETREPSAEENNRARLLRRWRIFLEQLGNRFLDVLVLFVGLCFGIDGLTCPAAPDKIFVLGVIHV